MRLKSIFMKLCTYTKLLFIIFFFFIWSPRAFALAGFAERDAILHYNNFADISWGYPSDACSGYSPYGQYCFYLIEKNTLSRPFNQALQKISISENSSSPFVLMKSTEGRWIIYDLELKGILFENDDFEPALEKWTNWGFQRVTFANATNLSDYFQETEKSKAKNRMDTGELFWLLVVIIFYLPWKFWLAVSFVLLLMLGVYIHELYSSSRPKSYGRIS